MPSQLSHHAPPLDIPNVDRPIIVARGYIVTCKRTRRVEADAGGVAVQDDFVGLGIFLGERVYESARSWSVLRARAVC